MESDKNISTPSDGLGEGIQKIRALHGRTTGPTRRSTKGQWTPEEDEILRRAVQNFKGKNWKKIAECFKDRTDVQCLHRWQKVLNPELVKGPWSKEEDEIIVELVNKYGPKKWSTIAQHLPGRIGKQCRERWHNHLNPSINKEAWTQEEEIALIRAHQIYGNKWAELTKVLPGRTDNSIKNHWNSSVKKKLDSYLKSGLLAQFQGLPSVGQQNQPMVPSSLEVHNGDDSCKKVTEVEDASECSQDSINAGCFQSSNEMAIVELCGEGPLSIDLPCSGKELNSSPVTCSDPYYPAMDEPTLSLADMSNDIGFVAKFLQQNYSHEAETSMGGDYQYDLHDMSNISSLELGQEALGMHSHCIGSCENQGHNILLQSSGELSTSSMGQMNMNFDKAEHMLISDEECCRILFTEAMKEECFFARNLELGSDVGPSVCQSSQIQISEADGSAASQMHHLVNSDVAAPACSQSFFSRLISSDYDPSKLDGDSNHLFGVQEQDYAMSSRDGFIYTNDSANSPCGDDTYEMGVQEQLTTLEDSSKLVPVNSFTSRSHIQTSPTGAKPNMDLEKHSTGALCYEPPRFPSFDVPFFSCELVQSGGEMQQEYSPLGIRQLMMSSVSCLTPYRLWNSPTRGDSPDAVLKSAAKTFTGTPSILKKRNRELMSPLSDRRKTPKTKTASRLTKDILHLDVFADEDSEAQKKPQSPATNHNRKSANSTEDKENLPSTSQDKEIQEQTSEETREQKTTNADDNKTKTEVDCSSQKPSGVLTEHNMNDLLFFSPKQLNSRIFGSIAKTPRSRHLKSSCVKMSVPLTSPSVIRKTSEVHPVSEASGLHQGSSTAVPEVDGGIADADTTAENFSIFGDTPYKRSIESPSAWKSPWFINSFVAGPRVDTDITIEDIGYFMSPGDRSYDAIGLMKQISEQTASAYANAQEVLGNDTPHTLLKKRRNCDIHDQENNVSSNQLGSQSSLHQNILTERRVLDFSECDTPSKGGTEQSKSSAASAIDLSSPSSYLLKSCR